ncbi:FAD-dependent oxidoreductase [Spirosoma sp. KCTC 42546]|uniref:NAD(P)/FAD-dependent oxidoreductase n=1 Tax=Spirosoma sp. KCTC 42546 TaxID=2520506 RepID=UPI00115B4F0E|nr:FAD-dependent oxidoreductase [Spirosoma sp. KCTC 42546]QDK81385.1 FAD-dependent oxidoreductase [Spirosoma sp. KCTC 42546]
MVIKSTTEDKKVRINRRQLLKLSVQGAVASALGATTVPAQASVPNFVKESAKNGRIVVVGAGAFGGWTALHLLRKGYKVTLVDQFGPGNNQSSSGGETRLIRAYYADPIYTDMAIRALAIWKENEARMGQKLLHQNGLLLFNYPSSKAESEAAVSIYKKAGLPLEKVSLDEAVKRWPQIGLDGLDHVMYDPTAGYLDARKGCQAVRDLFVKEGGTFLQQQVKQEAIKGGKATSITLANGTVLEADQFLFACGPWVTRLFPELTKKLIVTRALVFFFASPAGQSDFMENKLPTWMDRDMAGPFRSFGVPGSDFRGFKLGLTPPDNNVTDRFDTYNRFVKPEEFELALGVIKRRFPKMVGQPLIEQRVCQVTMTPDSDFILDTHPEADNLWVMGGDSGHGYKQGASFGEIAANTIAGEQDKIKQFALTRLLG